MRQHVPSLDNNLTNDDFLDLIIACFHSVIFGTVDQNGEPHTSIVDLDFREDNRLIFATTNKKNFYRNIKGNNRVCLTALRGRDIPSSVGFTLKGYVDEISPSYLDEILEIKPELRHIYDDKTEDLDALRAFALTPILGSVYDLRNGRVFQKQFDFVNEKEPV
ncbi:pyridoxamine 5'-phosphate oxidase family protein [uncultured Lactobacillus sp.]|uniref:pyridoxamine 5'-phosphate oxidase family protein n=1 Tax=uncultured Lactobacillus sp. TaxID=153152 RepID=UPI0028053B42|nr:pyridoxamine 5'-phosphate oxidase family protein [uncultured Lactobacillus sp.]